MLEIQGVKSNKQIERDFCFSWSKPDLLVRLKRRKISSKYRNPIDIFYNFCHIVLALRECIGGLGHNMVDIVQSVEHQIVVLVVAGSSPVIHP